MQGVGGSSPLVFTTSEQAFYRLLRFFIEKIAARSCRCSSFSAKGHARLACSVVNILMTAHSCCLFFAVYKDWLSYPQSTKNIFHAPAISTREVIAKITSLVIFCIHLLYWVCVYFMTMISEYTNTFSFPSLISTRLGIVQFSLSIYSLIPFSIFTKSHLSFCFS